MTTTETRVPPLYRRIAGTLTFALIFWPIVFLLWCVLTPYHYARQAWEYVAKFTRRT